MLETDHAANAAKGARILQLVKENRIEAMVITILLYSTGLLEKVVTYGHGVC
jgi:hypothetical protein